MMRPRSTASRKFLDMTVKVLSSLAALIGIFFLGWILLEVVRRGFSALNGDFFTELPAPPGMEGGGIANALLGTLAMTGIGAIVAIPLGVFGGVFLAEFGRYGRFGSAVRFAVNVMMGNPSIIVGLFIYAAVVKPFGHFSGYAGALALAIIMIPIIARVTEDMLLLVPDPLRESAMALGAPRWRVTMGVVFRAAKKGLLTGMLLAMARVAGETAPLLFTALNSPYWPKTLGGPTANITVTIFNYAMSPFETWHQIAWGASLLITASVLALNIAVRVSTKGKAL